MENDLQIRRMKMADIPAIEQIEHESWPIHGAGSVLQPATLSCNGFHCRTEGRTGWLHHLRVEDTGEEIYGHICSLAVGKMHGVSSGKRSHEPRMSMP